MPILISHSSCPLYDKSSWVLSVNAVPSINVEVFEKLSEVADRDMFIVAHNWLELRLIAFSDREKALVMCNMESAALVGRRC